MERRMRLNQRWSARCDEELEEDICLDKTLLSQNLYYNNNHNNNNDNIIYNMEIKYQGKDWLRKVFIYYGTYI